MAAKRKATSKRKHAKKPARGSRAAPRVERPYPRRTLDAALKVPHAIKQHNGGNPWASDQVATALGVGAKTPGFFYVTAASRDFGLTEGTRDTAEISLTPLGRRAVYPQSPEEEQAALREAFFRIDVFKRVAEHFGGNNLPEQRFRQNTLHQVFNLDPEVHEEFVDLFQKNCTFVGIGQDFSSPMAHPETESAGSVTIAQPTKGGDSPTCFVIMPFTEKNDRYPPGFFEEVLTNALTPALTAAGFSVRTAKRQGSDVIQSTIVNELLQADLVLADLTDHNPNVLFELGMRMAEDKPVALVRARGTGAIFDVDNMLRVEDYDPNLWKSTLEKDIPRLTDHVKATWENRETVQTFMKILRSKPS